MVWKIYYYFPFHFKPNMSPFVCVTIWNKSIYSHQTQNVTIWSCHHLKWNWLFISNWICHHLIRSPFEINSNQSPSWSENENFHLSDQVFIWWHLPPYEDSQRAKHPNYIFQIRSSGLYLYIMYNTAKIYRHAIYSDFQGRGALVPVDSHFRRNYIFVYI